MAKGKYIVFEGIDGAGKSTLISKLVNHIRSDGQKVRSTFEPTSNPIGSMIRHILSGRIDMSEETIAALFLADRIDHLQNKTNGILEYVKNGYHVLGDRYYLSSYAYHVPHVSLDWVINANSICAQLLKPDIILFIDISVEESLHRITSNRQDLDLFENKERITKVRDNYYSAIKKIKDSENIVMINGEQSPELVFNDIIKTLNDQKLI